MLRHKGVMYWYKYAKSHAKSWFNKIPFPNQFLGLKDIAEIDQLPVHILCAKRVIAHDLQFKHQKERLGERIRSISYENLIIDPQAEFDRVFTQEERDALGPFTQAETPKS